MVHTGPKSQNPAEVAAWESHLFWKGKQITSPPQMMHVIRILRSIDAVVGERYALWIRKNIQEEQDDPDEGKSNQIK